MKLPLSHRVSAWSVLPTAAFHGEILALQNAGEKVIDLTIAISNRPIPDKGKEAALQAIQANNAPYTEIGGSTELKRAIRYKLKQENSIVTKNENIIVSTGAKQAIFEALYVLTNPGDRIALFRPCWPAFTQMMAMLKLNPVFLDFDDIHELSNSKNNPNIKVLILNNPHNPTGKVFTRNELEAVASFVKKQNVFVITDESYEKLVYEGEFINFRTIDESLKDRIVTVFSVSQSFSMMGWRLGYAIAQKEVIQAMNAIQSSITAAPSAITQTAVLGSITSQNTHIKNLVSDFKQRRNAIYKQIAAIEWITCKLPPSGPYFWCNIEKVTSDSLQFSRKLLDEQKVAIMPGEAFGTPGWIRIAFNSQPIPVLETAVKRIETFGKK